jgi:hypothetical protein
LDLLHQEDILQVFVRSRINNHTPGALLTLKMYAVRLQYEVYITAAAIAQKVALFSDVMNLIKSVKHNTRVLEIVVITEHIH